MKGRCPHCGELNEYARPPTTAIVYCQHCRRPFGSASLGGPVQAPGAPSAAAPAASGRGPLRRPGSTSRAGGLSASPAANAAAPTAGIAAPPQLRAPLAPQQMPAVPAPARDAPRRPLPGAAPPSEDTRPPKPTVAAKVIVPKLVPRGKSDNGAPKSARLVYMSVEGMETEFELQDLSTIGRHPKNTIRLHDREVSKEHAIIEHRPEDESYLLRDLNSSNGTFVNNRRVREAVLQDGDELLFGSMRLKFQGSKAREVSPRDSVRDLVTIIPQENAGATHIHATIEDKGDQDFRPAAEITDIEVLKRDYEKLRITHELSRMGLTLDFGVLLATTLDVAFSLLPADNGVILLVDPETGVLLPHTVKRREPKASPQEIVLSHTVINQVINDRTSVLLSDAFLDPRFSGAESIISQGIRSAMCVPLVANNVVYGVIHLDSRQRIGAFTEKDLQLLKALAGQAAIAIANTRLLRKVEDDAKTKGQLSRFLPPHVVEEMVQGKGQPIMKSGRECDASVLFCDIRGFTTMSENAGGPQEIVDLLNDYFERLVEVVFQRRGVLDKFIGDALMAHWGTIAGDVDSTFNAVAAAIEFRDAIRQFNAERSTEGKAPVGMGVGVNTGRLVAGYMGARRRLEYTVIGDVVNTASRVCGLAEADQVLITESTYQLVADRIEARYLGNRKVKGKGQGVEVYEALAIRSAMSETGS